MNTRLNTNMSRIVHQTQDFLTYNETDGKVGVAPTQITLTDGDRDVRIKIRYVETSSAGF